MHAGPGAPRPGARAGAARSATIDPRLKTATCALEIHSRRVDAARQRSVLDLTLDRRIVGALCRRALRGPLRDGRAGDPRAQVDEVTRFAERPATAFQRVRNPAG